MMPEFLDSIRDNFNSLPTWGKAVIGVVAVGATSHLLFGVIFKRKRQSPYKTDYKPNVVYVYQFDRTAVIPSISPYALKLETWLRMADIEYENVKVPMWVRSREGQMPFVELNGIEYVDSSFIIRDLTRFMRKESVDAPLSDEQRAVSRAYQQMIENSTFWSYGYVRYVEKLEELFSDKVGFPIPTWWKILMPIFLFKKQIRKKMDAIGIGRHTREEIIGIGLDDLKSVSTYLGNKEYFHGDIPTTVDAFLFSVLAQIIYIPIGTPHLKALQTEYQNLIRYCDRIKARYWPDWDVICKTKALNTWKKA